jgi:pimeloyl-ACP methyl ester carboxylesterase
VIYDAVLAPDGVLEVVFRGTSNLGDGILDIEFLPRFLYPIGMVETGFSKGIEEVARVIAAAARAAGARSVWLGGHSLGAARAPLTGALLVNLGVAVGGIVMLAPPAAGYAPLWSDIQDVPQWAFVNGPDPVPRVPPTTCAWPYMQAPRPILLTEKPAGIAPLPASWHHVDLYVNGVERWAAGLVLPPPPSY